MTKLSNEKVIEMWLRFVKSKGWNQTRWAKEVYMSKGWASQIVSGKLKRLQFITRARILQVMNVIDVDYPREEKNARQNDY